MRRRQQTATSPACGTSPGLPSCCYSRNLYGLNRVVAHCRPPCNIPVGDLQPPVAFSLQVVGFDRENARTYAHKGRQNSASAPPIIPSNHATRVCWC
jgi:hypothetical protein